MVCTTGQASAAALASQQPKKWQGQDQQHSWRVRTSFCVAVWALCGLTRLGCLLLCCQPGHGDLVLPTLAHTAGAVGAHAVVRPQRTVTVDVDLNSSEAKTAIGNQGSVRRQRLSASAARHHAADAVGHAQLVERFASCRETLMQAGGTQPAAQSQLLLVSFTPAQCAPHAVHCCAPAAANC